MPFKYRKIQKNDKYFSPYSWTIRALRSGVRCEGPARVRVTARIVQKQKVSIVFEFKKGLRSTSAQAGVLVALSAALLVGCTDQAAPAEAGSERLAANTAETAEAADLPVVVVRATRAEKTRS